MIKKEDCKCDCHTDERVGHMKPCCEIEELGIDRFVITAPFNTGPFAGMLLETDEGKPYGMGGWAQPSFDMEPGFSVSRVYVNLEPYLEAMRKAVNRVHLMRLQPERITILKGEVAAHPEFRFHYLCPFCYPEMERAKRSV